MTVTLEHVRHRAEYFDEADRRLAWTKCGRRFLWLTVSTRDRIEVVGRREWLRMVRSA